MGTNASQDDEAVSPPAAKPSGHRTPRWVYAFIVLAVVGVLIVGALHLAGGGFRLHGL